MAYAINYKESITSNDAMHIPALSETQGELEGSTVNMVKCNGTEQWPSSPRLGLSKNCCGLQSIYHQWLPNIDINILCSVTEMNEKVTDSVTVILFESQVRRYEPSHASSLPVVQICQTTQINDKILSHNYIPVQVLQTVHASNNHQVCKLHNLLSPQCILVFSSNMQHVPNSSPLKSLSSK